MFLATESLQHASMFRVNKCFVMYNRRKQTSNLRATKDNFKQCLLKITDYDFDYRIHNKTFLGEISPKKRTKVDLLSQQSWFSKSLMAHIYIPALVRDVVGWCGGRASRWNWWALNEGAPWIPHKHRACWQHTSNRGINYSCIMSDVLQKGIYFQT